MHAFSQHLANSTDLATFCSKLISHLMVQLYFSSETQQQPNDRYYYCYYYCMIIYCYYISYYSISNIAVITFIFFHPICTEMC